MSVSNQLTTITLPGAPSLSSCWARVLAVSASTLPQLMSSSCLTLTGTHKLTCKRWSVLYLLLVFSCNYASSIFGPGEWVPNSHSSCSCSCSWNQFSKNLEPGSKLSVTCGRREWICGGNEFPTIEQIRRRSLVVLVSGTNTSPLTGRTETTSVHYWLLQRFFVIGCRCRTGLTGLVSWSRSECSGL